MKEVKPVNNREGWTNDEYYPIDDNGVMKCSCGRELIKMDEETYKCSGGYPVYRFSDGSVVIDKFGNLCIKKLSHEKDED